MSVRSIPLATRSRGLALLLLVLLAVAMTGCKTEPIRDLGPSAIPPNATQRKVERAIIVAGGGLGWSMQVQYPGLIVATRTQSDHVATVEIPYSARSFSIRYKDSRDLKYSSTDRTIHKVYNEWVASLNTAILNQVAMIK